MAIPVVSLDFPGDPPTFSCPVCGHKIYDEESDGSICKHIVLIGESFSGIYKWNDPTLEQVFQKRADKLYETEEE
ncbi:hypothetical protein KKI24_23885 [bacterium]|nr:hypothetical protein [bacterium]